MTHFYQKFMSSLTRQKIAGVGPAGLLTVMLLLIASDYAAATDYLLSFNADNNLVGGPPEEPYYAEAKQEDTLLDVARRYNIGQNEIVLLNPDVDRWLPGGGAKVRITNSRILPDTPRKGLTLNLPEFRLFFYPPAKKDQIRIVTTHPISIGRQDWNTPLGKTSIVGKKKDPTWTPPESIKKEHAAQGEILPNVVPAGPENPLGLYAMRLGVPGYLIHGTNKPYGVGMRVSHGCVRMYPEDIEKLFPDVRIGTPVYIVNQPIKAGWLNDTLYIEAHPPLEGQDSSYKALLEKALDSIEKANNNRIPVLNGASLRQALEQKTGIPVAIYHRPKELYDDIVL